MSEASLRREARDYHYDRRFEMKARHITGCVAGVVALVLAGPAFAQQDPWEPADPDPMEEEDPFAEPDEDPFAEPDEDPFAEPDPMDEEPMEPAPPVEPELEDPDTVTQAQQIIEDIGVGAYVGGGVIGFTEETARDLTNVGGSWEARLAFGTRFPVGIEAAYVGTAQDIEALGLDEDAILVGNGLEGLARINVPIIDMVTPYAFGGIGWTRYSLANSDFNTSNVQDNDNVGYVPLGAGVTYRVGRAAFDVRGQWKYAFNDDLIQEGPGAEEDDANLHQWGVTGRVGFEF
jgi:opacity protein-like surface antigen